MKIVSKEVATIEKTNYLGHIQHVDICVLGFKTDGNASISLYESDESDPTHSRLVDEFDAEYITSVGVAIQKDGDIYNKELGQKIAYNRALRPEKAFYVEAQTRGGLHDDKFRAQFLENLKAKDLGYFSYGYEMAERKYNERQKKLEEVTALQDQLSPENKAILNNIGNLSKDNQKQLAEFLVQAGTLNEE